ncbi:hypothetical protein HK101_001828 [Irineochytrium annulatum]|nr:hypothetical protein HK101_001828 [Irineochytrium annulatum]
MEPSAATGVLGYLFYALTRKEYTFENLHSLTFTNAQIALYKKRKLDVHRLALLKEKAEGLEKRIEALKEIYKV